MSLGPQICTILCDEVSDDEETALNQKMALVADDLFLAYYNEALKPCVKTNELFP